MCQELNIALIDGEHTSVSVGFEYSSPILPFRALECRFERRRNSVCAIQVLEWLDGLDLGATSRSTLEQKLKELKAAQ